MNKKIIILIILLIGLGLGFASGYYFGYDIGFEQAVSDSQIVENKPAVPMPAEFDVVRVETLKSGDKISSPVAVKGEAVGNWFFEASFPIDIISLNGELLGQGHVEAQSEWMTTDFVPFEGEISFDPGEHTAGYIIFRKDNPSGLPELEDSRRMKVTF